MNVRDCLDELEVVEQTGQLQQGFTNKHSTPHGYYDDS